MIPNYLKSIEPPTTFGESTVWCGQLGASLNVHYMEVSKALLRLAIKHNIGQPDVILRLYKNTITEPEFLEALKS